jgi:hypothetical protein
MSPPSRRIWSALIVGGALLGPVALVASSARADATDDQKKDQARDLAEKGDGQLEAKAYSDAETTFRKALGLFEAPTLHVRLARALTGEHKLLEARKEYRLVVDADLGPKPPSAYVDAVSQAKDELAGLEKRIPTIHVGKVAGRATGHARIDDENTNAGADVRVDPGKHRISGEDAVTLTLEVEEGASLNVDLPSASSPFPFRTSATPVFVLAGIGLFSISLGIGFTLDAASQRDDLDRLCGPNRICPAEVRPLRDAYVTSSVVSTTSFILGATAIVTGAIVFAVGKPLSSGGASVAIGPTGVVARKTW